MKFSYFPHPLDPSVTYPVVTAKIKGPTQMIEVRCLVDSGADIDSFPVSIAKEIGVPIENCQPESSVGIGGKAACYLYEIEIEVGGHGYRTKAQFLEPSQMIMGGRAELRDIPPLLGRKNTFSNFKIIFDEENKELELIPYPR